MNKWITLTVGVLAGALVSPLVVSAHAGSSECSFAALEARAALHDYRQVLAESEGSADDFLSSAPRRRPTAEAVTRLRVDASYVASWRRHLAGEYAGLRGDLVLCGGTTLP